MKNQKPTVPYNLCAQALSITIFGNQSPMTRWLIYNLIYNLAPIIVPIGKHPNNIVPIPLFNFGVIQVGIKFPKPRIFTAHLSPLCHGERRRGGGLCFGQI